jgi:hypothetical protein
LFTHVCECKNDTVETIPGIGEGRKKESGGGVNSSMIYLIHCKNFCKSHNVLPPSSIIKKKKESVLKD